MTREPGLDGRTLALALSAGGVRAIAQLGVLKAMNRYNLEPDVLTGTSGGAIVAALVAAGYSTGDLIELVRQWRDRGRSLVDLNWGAFLRALFRLSLAPVSGVVRGKRLEAVVARYMAPADSFASLSSGGPRKPLFITAVDLEDGEPVVFCDPRQVKVERDSLTGRHEGYRVCGRVPVSRAVRASVSIPGVFVPAPCLASCPERRRCQRAGGSAAGDRYVDGAVREFLPLAVAVRLARAGLVFGVNLGYAGLRRDGVAGRGLLEVVSQSLDIMSLDQVEESFRDELVGKARVVVLNPMIYDIGTFDLKHIPYLIERGEQAAEELFAARGLVPGGSPLENRRRLFPPEPGTLLFPPKGSEIYQRFLERSKTARPGPRRAGAGLNTGGTP